ncbi:FAD-dependent oxidoreductase [Bradyrhizobium erythrophlei]|uniref:2-polyprenyl-6-methoxyphenol hydroxylase n=1 Tax=Bradyrhizobium erythrophlei TaxID=1437360 RepID=A0A1H4Z2B1_9BRAD|nr:NAD(P)/FAD-dependent oxidoreductase [Bradyrhizobium erythrophlei]SED23501.1 2-polyprenyl-6-methoxyphenol hydroxylase [Bradyrhizobium erythrophlei]
MNNRRHVEIVGAGIAGLSAAIAFAQRGWSVRVHERMPEVRIVGSGLSIFENALRVLRVLDAEADTIRGAWMGENFQTRDRFGRVTSSRVRMQRMYEVTRHRLMAALLSSAQRAGAEITLGSAVASATPAGEIRLMNSRVLRADLVIVADGISSRLRDQLSIPYRRQSMQDGAIRTMTSRTAEETSGPDASTSLEYWSGHRRILVVPCSNTDLYVALTTLDSDEAGRSVPLKLDLWGEAFPGARSVVERLTGEARWDQFEKVKMRSWSAGRTVILGDAAHAMAPNLGQGGACAMMNALSLATRLEAAQDIPSALTEWERLERPLTDHTQLISGLYSDLTYWPNRLRAAAFWTVSKSKWLAEQTYRCSLHIPTGTEHLPELQSQA